MEMTINHQLKLEKDFDNHVLRKDFGARVMEASAIAA